MSEYVFVTSSHDYADEFDVDGCMVMDRAKFDMQMGIIKQAYDTRKLSGKESYYFGTNEALSFEGFDDFANGFTVQPCSDTFADEFRQLNRCNTFGNNTLERVYERACSALDRH